MKTLYPPVASLPSPQTNLQLFNHTVALILAGSLFVAGIGGGGVITPNQALSLREVDVEGGSTAGGMLQTAQRVGAAVGAATLTAVFYGQLSSRLPAPGPGRASEYGQAYSAALLVTVGMTVAALLLAVRESHVERRDAAGHSRPAGR